MAEDDLTVGPDKPLQLGDDISRPQHKAPKKVNRAFKAMKRNFLLVSVIYGTSVLGTLVYSLIHLAFWMIPGLIAGGIFVVMALYFYYDHILHPLIRQDPDEETMDMMLEEMRRSGSSPGLFYWFFIPLFLQNITLFGFGAILSLSSPLNGTPFTHPYQFGKVYTRTSSYFNLGNNLDRPNIKAEDLVEQSKVKDAILDEMMDRHFQARFTNDQIQLYPFPSRTSFLHVFVKNGAKPRQLAEMIVYLIPFLISGAFGFLGVLLYTLKDLSQRIVTNDIYDKTFAAYAIRFLFAPNIGMVIAYFLMDDWPVALAPVLFFYIGFFPQRAMQFIEARAMKFMGRSEGGNERAGSVSLDNLQGMDEYTIQRFEEVGIRNAQSLAYSDLTILHKQLRSIRRLKLADYVAQALLVVHVQDKLIDIARFGIRDIISLQEVLKSEKEKERLKQTAPDLAPLIEVMDSLLTEETLKNRIASIKNFIRSAQDQENASERFQRQFRRIDKHSSTVNLVKKASEITLP
ncbi:MAG: hypothetical protein HQL54_00640 [Magnetococcales bacterium]|nr:hypothetical protein [Magnetococcales bacterium]